MSMDYAVGFILILQWVWHWIRVCRRRCCRCFGNGKSNVDDEPLLPTRVDAAVSAAAAAVAGQQDGGGGGGVVVQGSSSASMGVQMAPADEYAAKHGVPMQGEEQVASWDDWTNEATQELTAPTETREERQKKKIENLFLAMEPEVIENVGGSKGKRSNRSGGGGGVSSSGRGKGSSSEGTTLSRLAPKSSFEVNAAFAGDDLGEIASDEDYDAWGGSDDDIDLADVKAVEREAKKKAREESRRLKAAARENRPKKERVTGLGAAKLT
eukprot:gene3306-11835_t